MQNLKINENNKKIVKSIRNTEDKRNVVIFSDFSDKKKRDDAKDKVYKAAQNLVW